MMQLYYPSISWAPTVLLVVPHVSGLGNIVRPGEGPGRLETGMGTKAGREPSPGEA
jgi:hypothetical protein